MAHFDTNYQTYSLDEIEPLTQIAQVKITLVDPSIPAMNSRI